MLEHGGDIIAQAQKYGIAPEHWLDLSTGINPNGWASPQVPTRIWQRLPLENDGLESVAQKYFGVSCILPIAGSQAAIKSLPALRAKSRVGVLWPSYNEHIHSWSIYGHQIARLDRNSIESNLSHLDVLVLVSPNNPTGERFDSRELREWASHLQAKDGWLVVDEAFMDATPQDSVLNGRPTPGLIVLRSLGKFFGLAGARVGFISAGTELLERVNEHLGPWAVTGPSRFIAKMALADRKWQQEARDELIKNACKLADLLSRFKLTISGSTNYFHWCQFDEAHSLYDFLAKRGILTRYFAEPASIRFGLPANENERHRLAQALEDFKNRNSADLIPPHYNSCYNK